MHYYKNEQESWVCGLRLKKMLDILCQTLFFVSCWSWLQTLQSVILPQIKHNKNKVKKIHRSNNRWVVGNVYVAG